MLIIRDILSIFVVASIFFSSSSNPGLAYTMEPAGRPIEAYAAVCGNWDVEDPETCDDGNNQDGDGCSCTCQYEEDMQSSANATATAN